MEPCDDEDVHFFGKDGCVLPICKNELFTFKLPKGLMLVIYGYNNFFSIVRSEICTCDMGYSYSYTNYKTHRHVIAKAPYSNVDAILEYLDELAN